MSVGYISSQIRAFHLLQNLYRGICVQESVQLGEVNYGDDANKGPGSKNSQDCQFLARGSERQLLYLEDWQAENCDVQEGVHNDRPELKFGVINRANGIGVFGHSLPERLNGIAVKKAQEGPAEKPDHRGDKECDDGHTDPEEAEEPPVQRKNGQLGEAERVGVCELEDVQIQRVVTEDDSLWPRHVG